MSVTSAGPSGGRGLQSSPSFSSWANPFNSIQLELNNDNDYDHGNDHDDDDDDNDNDIYDDDDNNNNDAQLSAISYVLRSHPLYHFHRRSPCCALI